MNVVDSVFEDNLVSENSTWLNNVYYGGGLYLFGEASVTVRSSNFSRNGAEKGGGILMRGNLTVNVEDSLFQDNIASSYGGGVFLTVGGVLLGIWDTRGVRFRWVRVRISED